MTSVHVPTPDEPTVDPFDLCVVTFPSGARAEFPYPVGTVVYVDDAPETAGAVVTVVRLEVPTGVVFNQNVFGLRRDGLIAWQITDKGVVDKDSPYVTISPDGDRLRAYNWSGIELWLDPQTGAVLDGRLSRF